MLGQDLHVERQLAGGPGGEERQGDDADEHQGTAGHRVEEELEGGVDPVAVAPTADQEVHRHQHDLEEEEEQEQVEGHEHAHRAGHQDHQPQVVGLRIVVVVGGEDGDGEQDAAQHDEEQRDPVDTEEPLQAEVFHPGGAGHELETGLGLVELGQHPQRHGAGDRRAEQGGGLQLGGAVGTDEGDHHGGEHRDEDQGRPDGEGRRVGGFSSENDHANNLRTRAATTTTTPPTNPRAYCRTKPGWRTRRP